MDECLTPEICPENAICNNQPGSYACQCISGYQMNSTDLCEDIDECTTANSAHQLQCQPNSTCQNVIGSAECICNYGFDDINGTCTGT